MGGTKYDGDTVAVEETAVATEPAPGEAVMDDLVPDSEAAPEDSEAAAEGEELAEELGEDAVE